MSDVQDVWPPLPEDNYRKSHLITAEWVDKVSHIVTNRLLMIAPKYCSSKPS